MSAHPITHTTLEQIPVGDSLQTTIRHLDQDGREVAEITSTHRRVTLRVEDYGVEHVLPELAR